MGTARDRRGDTSFASGGVDAVGGRYATEPAGTGGADGAVAAAEVQHSERSRRAHRSEVERRLLFRSTDTLAGEQRVLLLTTIGATYSA